MRPVSSDSLSKGDKMSQVETFPGPHNANRQLANPPPPFPYSIYPPFPKAEEWVRRGRGASVMELRSGKKERKYN